MRAALQLTDRRARRRGLAVALLLGGLALACASDGPPPAPTLGQWIWTARDSALLQATRRQRPAIVAGVWVATLSRRGDSLITELGRPLDASAGPDAEVVIRIDDSFSSWWEEVPLDSMAGWVSRRLERLLPLVDATTRDGTRLARAVQLDYDAPVAHLADYAALLARLRRADGGVLHGRPLRITSLMAHLRDPAYGPLFRPHVDGHIVQLFDTGERHDARAERGLLERLETAGLPFHVGLGAFERRLATGATMHRAWFDVLPLAARSRWFRGTWIFPAGTPYLKYLAP
jgi:hypothetical protein